MKTLRLVGIVPLVLLAAAAFPQGHAVPRGGGSGGGGGSSAGSRHTGGGGGGGGSHGSSAPSNNGGGGSSSASSGGSGRSYSTPGAANRRPRPGTGTGTRDYYGNEYNHYGYYGGGYYPYYGYGYGYGYGYPYYGYGYGYWPYAYWGYPYSYGIGFSYYGGYPYSAYGYGPYGYYGGGGGDGGGGGTYETRSDAVVQVRTLVDPPQTLVYVDGRQAGKADDFDGMFQRLNISPGRHEIALKLDGYGTHTYTVYTGPEETLKLRWDMVKGGSDSKEVIGEEHARRIDEDREQQRARERERELAREAERDREAAAAREVDANPSAERPSLTLPAQGGGGGVFLDIQPSDASVYIDGEFRGKASQLARLDLPPGRHRVEVVRPGYRTTETVITVDGEAKKLVIKLDR